MAHMVVSLGYVAQGQQALLHVQESDMALQQIERQQMIRQLQTQVKTMDAMSTAATNSASADAYSSFVEAGQQGAQALSTVVQMGTEKFATKSYNEPLNTAQTKLKDINEFETKFNDTKKADTVLTDVKLKELTTDEQDRYNQIKENQGPIKYKTGDEKLFAHIKADETTRTRVLKNISTEKQTATLDQNTQVQNRESTRQKVKFGFDILNGGLNAASSGVKGLFAESKKGPAESLRVLAQAQDQNIQAALSRGTESASSYEQQAAQINRAREELANNGRG
jgi:hypothetical protein